MCRIDESYHQYFSESDADIYSSRTDLQRRYFTGFANDFHQFHNGNVDTGFKQYRDYDLYFYANRRTMCGCDDDVDYRKCECDANV